MTGYRRRIEVRREREVSEGIVEERKRLRLDRDRQGPEIFYFLGAAHIRGVGDLGGGALKDLEHEKHKKCELVKYSSFCVLVKYYFLQQKQGSLL
jgi:hypothetical protein